MAAPAGPAARRFANRGLKLAKEVQLPGVVRSCNRVAVPRPASVQSLGILSHWPLSSMLLDGRSHTPRQVCPHLILDLARTAPRAYCGDHPPKCSQKMTEFQNGAAEVRQVSTG